MASIHDTRHTQHSPVNRGSDLRSQDPAIRHRMTPEGRNGRSEDSWIEVASQPSSSSLSSAATNDEIVTTGLRIEHQEQHLHHRRRRRFTPRNVDITYPHHQPSSSQDEYEETESESDPVLSSSNEDLTRHSRPQISFLPGTSSPSEVALSSSDEDDNSTALGLVSNATSTFTPHPNAFSHPPVSQQTSLRSRTTVSGHVSGRQDSRIGSRRDSRSSIGSARRLRQQQQHSPYNMISPSHQADNDAALRASLSTLLSCAAAARGLPKANVQRTAQAPPAPDRTPSGGTEPSAFRLVPESVAIGEDGNILPAAADHHPPHLDSSPSVPQSPFRTAPRSRRRASPSKDRSTGQPAAKRSRRAAAGADSSTSSAVSPTVMTWVISAGVVVLFSAISFSAGYVLGREVGRVETGQAGFYGASGGAGIVGERGCGKEAVGRGLRKIRWIGGGTGSGVSV